MPIPQDIRHQLQKIDEQIIDLLSERFTLCHKAIEEDEGAFDAAYQAETLTDWEGAADEKGLNLLMMNHLCKLVMKLSQSTEE
jgi:chorismate mutase